MLREKRATDHCRSTLDAVAGRRRAAIGARVSASLWPIMISTRRHFRSDSVAKFGIGISLTTTRAGSGEIEPFVGQDEILTNAVALVIHQAEHGLGEGIALNGAARMRSAAAS